MRFDTITQFLKPDTLAAIVADLRESAADGCGTIAATEVCNEAVVALGDLIGIDDARTMIEEASDRGAWKTATDADHRALLVAVAVAAKALTNEMGTAEKEGRPVGTRYPDALIVALCRAHLAGLLPKDGDAPLVTVTTPDAQYLDGVKAGIGASVKHCERERDEALENDQKQYALVCGLLAKELAKLNPANVK